jgi:hypothetical protein
MGAPKVCQRKQIPIAMTCSRGLVGVQSLSTVSVLPIWFRNRIRRGTHQLAAQCSQRVSSESGLLRFAFESLLKNRVKRILASWETSVGLVQQPAPDPRSRGPAVRGSEHPLATIQVRHPERGRKIDCQKHCLQACWNACCEEQRFECECLACNSVADRGSC